MSTKTQYNRVLISNDILRYSVPHKVLSMQSLAVVAMVTLQKYPFASQESTLTAG